MKRTIIFSYFENKYQNKCCPTHFLYDTDDNEDLMEKSCCVCSVAGVPF